MNKKDKLDDKNSNHSDDSNSDRQGGEETKPKEPVNNIFLSECFNYFCYIIITNFI